MGKAPLKDRHDTRWDLMTFVVRFICCGAILSTLVLGFRLGGIRIMSHLPWQETFIYLGGVGCIGGLVAWWFGDSFYYTILDRHW